MYFYFLHFIYKVLLFDDKQLVKTHDLLQVPGAAELNQQESPADAVKPARRKSMQKLLQFDVFRFISPNSISPNFKV